MLINDDDDDDDVDDDEGKEKYDKMWQLHIDDYYDDKVVNDDENYGTLFLQFQEY